jgi:precorrin-6B C5,15-methyltransferase / cobalt-precorrin-6B C5,C15-methyltransferase
MSRDSLSSSDRDNSPWLAIVGLGADGAQALCADARDAIERAELVAGSGRQLALVQALIRGETLRWPSPLADGIERVLARRGRSTCVLASGDPFFYGIGATLAPRLARAEFVCFPAPSSVSLAASRLGWPLADTEVVSLHGRDLHGIVRYLRPGGRVMALSWDRTTPALLAALLVQRGFGRSQLHVLECLGGPSERVRGQAAAAWLETGHRADAIADLNLIALELIADPGAFSIPLRASLPDRAFEHDGQLTKQDQRALTLSALGPLPGQLLWDVGAGAGSIAIEWLLAHPACRAIAIESDPARCARIRRNAQALGVPALQVIQARAPERLHELPEPNAVFIGGGASDPSVFDTCWQRLASGGRLVLNAVALETEALVLAAHARHGGELCRFSIEKAEPLGRLTGWSPARSLLQWRVDKP